jgi:hypothetical protein
MLPGIVFEHLSAACEAKVKLETYFFKIRGPNGHDFHVATDERTTV